MPNYWYYTQKKQQFQTAYICYSGENSDRLHETNEHIHTHARTTTHTKFKVGERSSGHSFSLKNSAVLW